MARAFRLNSARLLLAGAAVLAGVGSVAAAQENDQPAVNSSQSLHLPENPQLFGTTMPSVIKATAIDGALFKDEVDARKVMAVPTTFLNGAEFASGRMELEQILAKIDTGASTRAAERIKGKEPFEVLVIGGGPAGAAAAIYAARKGIRTGVAAERFGGQVLDTLGIENFISVQHTEGPKLAAQLESHVRDYGVDVMNLQ